MFGISIIMGILATPPPPKLPLLRNSRPYSGFINHWFPLIRPAINPLLLGGSFGGGGAARIPLISGEICGVHSPKRMDNG